jgi:hypothetical protein
VDHAVAVRANQNEIPELRLGLAGSVKRDNVVAFDIALTVFAVPLLEVKTANLAD